MQVCDLNEYPIECVYSVVCVSTYNITMTKTKVLQPLAGLFPVIQNELLSLSAPSAAAVHYVLLISGWRSRLILMLFLTAW